MKNSQTNEILTAKGGDDEREKKDDVGEAMWAMRDRRDRTQLPAQPQILISRSKPLISLQYAHTLVFP